MAFHRKKGKNVNTLPQPIQRELFACICWGCDQYFYVERAPILIDDLRCPLCKAPKSQAEVLGICDAVITMR